MSSCQNIGHIGLSSLISAAGCLQQLTLAYSTPVSVWSFPVSNGSFTRFISYNIVLLLVQVTLEVADSLKKLSMLQSIKLDGCLVTCEGLKAIGVGCVSLRELSLSKCSGVTDEGLSFVVTKHRELKKLDITCCRKLTDVSVAHISNSCTGLTSLKMETCTLVSREAFVLIGRRCHFLEELDLTDNEIDDEGFPLLKCMEASQDYCISSCTYVSSSFAGLKSISRCSRLSTLKLGICLNITDEGLIHIGMFCSKLREIDLYRFSFKTLNSNCPY